MESVFCETNLRIHMVLLAVATCTVGCTHDEITSYHIPRVEKEVGEPVRMLGAVLPVEDHMWFFKLLGPEPNVADVATDFTAFLKSVHFKDGEIQWEAPKEWKRREGDSMRFATLLIGEDPKPLELSITRLSQSPLLDNINRWRGQISLSPISEADLEEETTVIESRGLSMRVVDMTGTSSGGGMRAPFMSGGGMPASGQSGGPSPGSAGSPNAGGVPQMEAPADWQPHSGSSMSIASWKAGDTVVTVTPLGGPAGGLLDNVRRWCNQIGMPPVTADSLKSVVETVEIGGHSGSFVTLIPEQAAGPEALNGAIVTVGRTTWFFKQRGPVEAVKAQTDTFRTFVQNVQF